MDDKPGYTNEDLARLSKWASPSVPDAPRWGDVEQVDEYSWQTIAPCGCWVNTDAPQHGGTTGGHCDQHTFAHLVSGESLLRDAQKKEKEGGQ
jgi:hypothetical protein